MSHTILIKEKDINSREIVYVKGIDTKIVSLNASLVPGNSLTFNILKDVLLPQGYPGSVSEDYLSYQLWDTLQAFCSTITNTLATRAVLQGVGVGDQAASAVSAAITWVWKDGVGMTARILFAWICGSRLDGECKKWRLFADIINDVAICSELLLLPLLRREQTLPLLCLSTSIKGLVGVAGGATRASITQHQAICNNMADVSAKDGSQETCVNLVASAVGIVILSCFGESSSIMWVLFFSLTGLHLFANYKAVRSLNFNKFNSERLNFVLKEFLMSGRIPSSIETNLNESVLPLSNRHSCKNLCYYEIKIGESIKKLAKLEQIHSLELQLICNLYKKRNYLILFNWKSRTIYILLERSSSNLDIYEAYFHGFIQAIASALLLKKHLPSFPQNGKEQKHSLVRKIKRLVESHHKQMPGDKMRMNIEFIMSVDALAGKEFPDFLDGLKQNDWSLEDHFLPVGDWNASWKN